MAAPAAQQPAGSARRGAREKMRTINTFRPMSRVHLYGATKLREGKEMVYAAAYVRGHNDISLLGRMTGCSSRIREGENRGLWATKAAIAAVLSVNTDHLLNPSTIGQIAAQKKMLASIFSACGCTADPKSFSEPVALLARNRSLGTWQRTTRPWNRSMKKAMGIRFCVRRARDAWSREMTPSELRCFIKQHGPLAYKQCAAKV